MGMTTAETVEQELHPEIEESQVQVSLRLCRLMPRISVVEQTTELTVTR